MINAFIMLPVVENLPLTFTSIVSLNMYSIMIIPEFQELSIYKASLLVPCKNHLDLFVKFQANSMLLTQLFDLFKL